MRKNKSFVLAVLFVGLAVFVAYSMDTGGDVPYSVSSTSVRGASLLFDTLRHMGYNVRTSRNPLTAQTDASHVYIAISPPVNDEEVAEILEWVYQGGRLIFLCVRHPFSPVDRALVGHERNIGEFLLYRHGGGEIVTGRARQVTNGILMENYQHGQFIQETLGRWDAENIFFAEYYHGFRTSETFVGSLPLAMRLVLLQAVILAVAAVFHLGKRFGNPVVHYPEVEREENEYVHALARLYMESGKHKK